MNKLTFLSSVILVAGVVSCNKDNVITTEPENPGSETNVTLKVYEYIPAPGQFINESTGDITAAEAAAWAEERLEKNEIVSLGGFGGYIIVGFGHSIGDFIVKGNAFVNTGGASNEPGIVYVMQDTNGNGLPDDKWYELKGSETGAESTIQHYAVTYFRPTGNNSDVLWTDNCGGEGSISYMATVHKQPSYYPAWIEEDTYTLAGTFVKARTEKNAIGQWFLNPLDYGYADNIGTNNDVFYLADAISEDGQTVDIHYIDFIKIQTGVQGQCGPLGELSTEIVKISEK